MQDSSLLPHSKAQSGEFNQGIMPWGCCIIHTAPHLELDVLLHCQVAVQDVILRDKAHGGPVMLLQAVFACLAAR